MSDSPAPCTVTRCLAGCTVAKSWNGKLSWASTLGTQGTRRHPRWGLICCARNLLLPVSLCDIILFMLGNQSSVSNKFQILYFATVWQFVLFWCFSFMSSFPFGLPYLELLSFHFKGFLVHFVFFLRLLKINYLFERQRTRDRVRDLPSTGLHSRHPQQPGWSAWGPHGGRELRTWAITCYPCGGAECFPIPFVSY